MNCRGIDKFNYVKESLLKFLEVATDEDYDAIFYFIGQYDFDQNNPIHLEIVTDVVLNKASEGYTNQYKGGLEGDIGRLYKYPFGAAFIPASVQRRAKARESREENAVSFTYIPESEELYKHLKWAAGAAVTSESTEEVLKRRVREERSERFWDELCHPAKYHGQGMAILYYALIIYALLSVLKACMY